MRTRILALGLGLALLAGLSFGDALHNKRVSATATVQTVPLGGVAMLTIINEGGNEIYVRIFREGEPVTDAVASDAGGIYIASGSTIELPTSLGPYGAVSIVCSAGETATVNLLIP